MTQVAAELPLWAAILVAFFLLLGASLSLTGAVGFLRLPTFYQRIHAPTLGTSWGIGSVMVASMLFFSVATGRVVVHEILVGFFVTVTTPVTFMLLARAALYRDRMEQNGEAPEKRLSGAITPTVEEREPDETGGIS